ncbi:MAG: Crp/Fnr family transcriptional regulator [Agathobacter sp.]|uniref:Crp/Fnr family transcriptional regulator n=1 Tax=Agathobacter sp. TaxID=2021311 RepID=UPI00257E57AB|nr:Crp/Fnr family transcriptional regulator [Agathobacter sp.]MBQ1682301.1 Crp/Fnr family transcriptional regulator [Agathobacter sp.]
MTGDFEIIQKSILFRDMNEREIHDALGQMSATVKNFQKNEPILLAGSYTNHMYLILSGSVTIESNDLWGNRSILSHLGAGAYFAETYALLEHEPLQVDARANEDSRIMLFSVNGLRDPKVLANILLISLQKNLHLSERSFHTSPKTIRGRVMAYLNSVSLRSGQKEFDIPFDRQQLADYLNVERTALSKELGKMQREGLITVRMNHFRLG